MASVISFARLLLDWTGLCFIASKMFGCDGFLGEHSSPVVEETELRSGEEVLFLPLQGAVYHVVACPKMGHEV